MLPLPNQTLPLIEHFLHLIEHWFNENMDRVSGWYKKRAQRNGLLPGETKELNIDWATFLRRCKVIPYRPAPETHLIDLERPHEVPGEEFRSLRTRLNHLQSQQELHSLVMTSASPAEGKSFTAVNLALDEIVKYALGT